MAQRHYLTLAGGTTVEVSDRVDLEDWELTEKAEEGAVGSGTIWIADPAMDLDIDGLRAYVVLEDASTATDNVLFGGFVADPELSRGEQGGAHYDPVARAWQIQLTDTNGRWNRRVMTGSDCKRPAETDVQRIAWLFASNEGGWVEDATTYVATTGGSAMDKVDYRGQYLNQVIDDCAQQSGRNWWVQLQETGTGREEVAWYAKDSVTGYDSELWLSNDPADLDPGDLESGASLIWPLADQTRLRRDLSRVYTAVYLRYAGGARAIYRKHATSPDVYGRRDHVADYPNVKTKAKAEARAARLLADLATPDERITTEVVLPRAKATMIRAGMRVRVKATHLVGYGDQFYWMRVLECSVSPRDAGTRYRLRLVLQASGASEAGNGPYTGDAFASLLNLANWGDVGPGNEAWLDIGNSGVPAGWFLEPTVGPMSVSLGSQAVTVEADMIVRIHAQIDVNMVYLDAGSANMWVYSSVFGGPIGGDGASGTEAGYNLLPATTFTVDIHNYEAVEGETFYLVLQRFGITNGGFWSASNNANAGDGEATGGTFLRVGRGRQVWNEGKNWWEGP